MPGDRLARVDDGVRVTAAFLGTLPVSVLGGIALARLLPLAEDVRFTVGIAAVPLLWVMAICFGFLARRAWRVVIACIGLTAVLAALVYGVPS